MFGFFKTETMNARDRDRQSKEVAQEFLAEVHGVALYYFWELVFNEVLAKGGSTASAHRACEIRVEAGENKAFAQWFVQQFYCEIFGQTCIKEGDIVGTWKSSPGSVTMELTIRDDGSSTMCGRNGKYFYDGNFLRLGSIYNPYSNKPQIFKVIWHDDKHFELLDPKCFVLKNTNQEYLPWVFGPVPEELNGRL